MAEGLVRGASLIGDVVGVNPLVGVLGVTAIAAVVGGLTGDEDLGREIDIGPLGLAGDLDAVGEGGSGGECPAATAVYGDVLVALDGEVVDSVDIAPPIALGEFGLRDLLDWLDNMRFEGGGGLVLAVHGDIQREAYEYQKAQDRNFNHFLYFGDIKPWWFIFTRVEEGKRGVNLDSFM